jgi:hypothetical protein
MEPKMTEEELKRRAEKYRAGITEAWPYLKEKGYVGEALDEPVDQDMVEYIIEAFDDLPEKVQGGFRSRRQARGESRGRGTVRVSLERMELERQAALEQYLAMCAACDADVYSFRKEVLDGRLLAADQARDLLRSPAAAILRTRRFREKNIPIVGHTAEVKSPDPEVLPWGSSYVATVIVDPPGVTQEERMPSWGGPPWTEFKNQRPVVLEFPDGEGGIARRGVWSISLLGELTRVGEKLSERYRWQPAQAVWFVLTGEIPAVPSLRVTRSFSSSMYHSDTLITVEASPWISPRTVKRAFRKAQIKTLGDGGRRTGEKHLKLLRFVIERIEWLGSEELGMLDEGKRPPGAPKRLWGLELVAQYPWYRRMPKGKEIVREWNETYPQWSYKDNGKADTRRFWRDYHRIKKSVAFGPPYKW